MTKPCIIWVASTGSLPRKEQVESTQEAMETDALIVVQSRGCGCLIEWPLCPDAARAMPHPRLSANRPLRWRGRGASSGQCPHLRVDPAVP
jgi:hypothetical protein